MDFIFKHFDQLMPIVILIIITIASTVGQNKNKGKKAPPPPPPQTPKPRQAPQPQAKPQKRAAPAGDWTKADSERKRKETVRAQTAGKRGAAGSLPFENSEEEAFDYTPVQPERENILAAQARNGVVWSELLQPPVSMR